MKIKKLILRNIASIEKADIDFENGLNDAFTGTPANTFLIYGDTGTGKSVLLDGISMALYKTTPRIKNVVGKTKNRFTNAEGESVDINDLEQYTRIGISPNDECYSEVVFEGIDGIEYHAKLTLGVTQGNTNKDGIRPIKYSKIKWELKTGNKDYEKVDISAGNPICDAIGLTFEQFNRMAMLAQGEFDTFLTGGKKEREEVLEKLTQTEKYSKYGEAIARLFSAASKRLSNETVEYDTIEKILLKESDIEEYTKKLTEYDNDKKGKETEKKIVDEKIGNLDVIETNKGKIATATENLKTLEGTYRNLSADLQWRVNNCQALVSALEEPRLWLDQQGDKRPLFESAGKVDLQLNSLKNEQKKKADAEEEKKRLTTQTDGLAKEVANKKSAEESAKKAVTDKQGEIAKLTEERQLLKPEETNKNLNAATLRKNGLNTLEGNLTQYEMDVKAEENLGKEISEAEKKLNEEFLPKKNAAEKEWDEADKADKEARDLLTTMKMSVEETLVNLRKRLFDEKTEICPLCGQHINELHIDKDFNALVTPLQERQKETAEKLKEAAAKKDEATKEYNTANNNLSADKGKYESSKNKNAATKKNLDTAATVLGLDTQQPLLPQIEPLRQKIDIEIGELETTLKKAKELQDKIDGLNNDKTADNNLLDATQKRGAAESALSQNTQNIKNQETKIQEAIDTIASLSGELHSLLDKAYPEWDKEIDNTRDKLKKDSNEYNGRKSQYDKDTRDVEKAKVVIDTISKTHDKVVEICPKWKELELEAKQFPCSDIQSRWTDLFSKCTSNIDDIKNAKSEIATKMELLNVENEDDLPNKGELREKSKLLFDELQELSGKAGGIRAIIESNDKNSETREKAKAELDAATIIHEKWYQLNNLFGGSRFRTLAQSYILRPLLKNANLYLEKITDRYTLTCSDDNEQLAILVHDNYNCGEMRSVTVLSGGERFMISLALSLALSSLNHQSLNTNILFIDEGFGTLDEKNLDSVMSTLEKLQEIAGQSNRRVGIISHREELERRIPVKILVQKKKNGQGQSVVEIVNS